MAAAALQMQQHADQEGSIGAAGRSCCSTKEPPPLPAMPPHVPPPSRRRLKGWCGAHFCPLQAVTRKVRIMDVAYNASNNELVSFVC